MRVQTNVNGYEKDTETNVVVGTEAAYKEFQRKKEELEKSKDIKQLKKSFNELKQDLNELKSLLLKVVNLSLIHI